MASGCFVGHLLHQDIATSWTMPKGTYMEAQGSSNPVMGVSQNQVYHFGYPQDEDSSILGFILGYRNLGKSPYHSTYDV